MRDMLNDRVMASLHLNPRLAERLPQIEAEVRAGRLLPTLAVDKILSLSGIGSK
jgi:LAO/AO transport system kinase